jgi:hypothetical protein
VRRLTTEGDDGWIIPELTRAPTNSLLFWTEQRIVDRERVPLVLKPLERVARAIELAEDPPLPDAPSTTCCRPPSSSRRAPAACASICPGGV